MAALPNALTALRFVLVIPTLWCIADDRTLVALVLFVVAGLTDALDGTLARRLNARTALGATLDPVADKALLSGVYIMLALVQVLPAWLALLVVARDFAILLGAGVIRLCGGAYVPVPSRLSRFNTVAQVTLGAGVLATEALAPDMTRQLAAVLVPVVAVTTVTSGLAYAWAAARGPLRRRRADGGRS
nr:CDP-alcohol phosphatidyltransferase family protein [Roseospira goensis]